MYKIQDLAIYLGIEFENDDLLNMALTHPSYHQDSNYPADNQRLEFLGDAVLSLVVTEVLFERFPEEDEGVLTKIRAKIVCEKALVQVARAIELGDYLRLGRGEQLSGGRNRKSILADAMEAVIGAIYLDQGYEVAAAFVRRHFREVMENAFTGDHNDYKSKLQELVQAKNQQGVTYVILSDSGPAHAKIFTAGVYYQDRLLATGSGKSKKEAGRNAAEKALQDQTLLNRIL